MLLLISRSIIDGMLIPEAASFVYRFYEMITKFFDKRQCFPSDTIFIYSEIIKETRLSPRESLLANILMNSRAVKPPLKDPDVSQVKE